MMEKILNKIKFYTDEEQAWFFIWYERYKRTGIVEYPTYVDGEDIPQGVVEIMNEVINFHRFTKPFGQI